MSFIKITSPNGKSEFIATNKILKFGETELTEKGKQELGEDKQALKIETLENRQYLAVGTSEEIETLKNEILQPNSVQSKIETALDRFLNPQKVEPPEGFSPLSGITFLEDLDRKYEEVLHRLEKLEDPKNAA